ncbi:MAG: cob(I)yrinic acid a,c-diamide adenosyltransferase [Phycisphaerales bacterium]|nr:cob(I)yrinic acid a,c-diamide adenosyltransferase [Phycisphaerales bacterium]
MKIYTRTGDDGTTGLIGGQRLSKSDPRLDTYGTLDELNASLGLAASLLPASASQLLDPLHQIQSDLFTLGSHLACADPKYAQKLPSFSEDRITWLEQQIDAADAILPPLQQFILPGGTPAASHLHLARTICRRAERLLANFAASQPTPPLIFPYLNRLSDWLFTQARLVNQLCGVADIPWRA